MRKEERQRNKKIRKADTEIKGVIESDRESETYRNKDKGMERLRYEEMKGVRGKQ